jgi:hypothetical protein
MIEALSKSKGILNLDHIQKEISEWTQTGAENISEDIKKSY